MTHKPSRPMRWMKWAALVGCLATAVGFAVSTQRSISWTSSDVQHGASLLLGGFYWGWHPEGWRLEDQRYPPIPGWSVAHCTFRLDHLSWWITRGALPTWEWVTIPLWMPFVCLAVPTGVLWYRDRRAIAETVDRWRARLCPTQPRRVTVWLVVVCSMIHVAVVIPCMMLESAVSNFFMWTTVWELELWIGPVLFWGTPVLGTLWAWLYARYVNTLFIRMRPDCCAKCGYDLTGNVSGRCPECGVEA